ncbi:hypothetical protein, partial [Enterobacter hormaechei]|uniref:hypothetical protein n=1 Tax=Enterobacter hormaechei TaxID=158836 RepID=UPI001953F05F
PGIRDSIAGEDDILCRVIGRKSRLARLFNASKPSNPGLSTENPGPGPGAFDSSSLCGSVRERACRIVITGLGRRHLLRI